VPVTERVGPIGVGEQLNRDPKALSTTHALYLHRKTDGQGCVWHTYYDQDVTPYAELPTAVWHYITSTSPAACLTVQGMDSGFSRVLEHLTRISSNCFLARRMCHRRYK